MDLSSMQGMAYFERFDHVNAQIKIKITSFERQLDTCHCPYYDPKKKGEKKSDFTMCPYFCKNLSVVM